MLSEQVSVFLIVSQRFSSQGFSSSYGYGCDAVSTVIKTDVKTVTKTDVGHEIVNLRLVY